MLEKQAGINPVNIAGRQAEHPIIHGTAEAAGLGTGLYSGLGEAAGIAKVANAIVPKSLPLLGKLGSAAIKSGIEMGLYQGSDEISKALLDQQGGDPQAAVASALANIKNAALMGTAAGGVFNVLGRGAGAALQDTKLGARLNDFMAGIGAASEASKTPGELIAIPEGADPNHFHSGVKFYNEGISKAVGKIPRAAADIIGSYEAAKHGDKVLGGIAGGMIDQMVGPYMEKLFNRPLTSYAQKTIVPAVLKVLSNGSPEAIGQAIDYAGNISQGARNITNNVESLFKGPAQQTFDYSVSDKERQKLKDFIEQGGVDQQVQNQIQQNNSKPMGFAHGGEVPAAPIEEKNHLANLFPEQNTMLSSARGRISSYLNGLRPLPNQSKLPFDEPNPNTEQNRSYDKAIDLAINPLSIFRRIKNGQLDIEDIKHANALHPEVMDHLRKKVTERIMKAQLNNEMPSYGMRQNLSMFLGAALDGSLTQPAIAAAQNVFAQKQAAQQQAPPQKKTSNKSSLSKVSDNYRTDEQARKARAQAQ